METIARIAHSHGYQVVTNGVQIAVLIPFGSANHIKGHQVCLVDSVDHLLAIMGY